MIYVVSALLIAVLAILGYVLVSGRLRERRAQAEVDKVNARYFEKTRPADVKPTLDEIKKTEERRDEIKTAPADTAGDVDNLIGKLNGR